jgi:hypothetical protein
MELAIAIIFIIVGLWLIWIIIQPQLQLLTLRQREIILCDTLYRDAVQVNIAGSSKNGSQVLMTYTNSAPFPDGAVAAELFNLDKTSGKLTSTGVIPLDDFTASGTVGQASVDEDFKYFAVTDDSSIEEESKGRLRLFSSSNLTKPLATRIFDQMEAGLITTSSFSGRYLTIAYTSYGSGSINIVVMESPTLNIVDSYIISNTTDSKQLITNAVNMFTMNGSKYIAIGYAASGAVLATDFTPGWNPPAIFQIYKFDESLSKTTLLDQYVLPQFPTGYAIRESPDRTDIIVATRLPLKPNSPTIFQDATNVRTFTGSPNNLYWFQFDGKNLRIKDSKATNFGIFISNLHRSEFAIAESVGGQVKLPEQVGVVTLYSISSGHLRSTGTTFITPPMAQTYFTKNHFIVGGGNQAVRSGNRPGMFNINIYSLSQN